MEKFESYCKSVACLEPSNVNCHYHDKDDGFPIESDN